MKCHRNPKEQERVQKKTLLNKEYICRICQKRHGKELYAQSMLIVIFPMEFGCHLKAVNYLRFGNLSELHRNCVIHAMVQFMAFFLTIDCLKNLAFVRLSKIFCLRIN
nr:MAG TPA: hypothetical protein [Caudoviricetes sp.]